MTFKVDSLRAETTIHEGVNRVYSAANKPTSSDVGLGNVPNTVHTTAATANTVAVRDASGDLHVRLIRNSYQNENTISGAIGFRVDTEGNNYNRYCSNTTAIKTWLGALSLSGGVVSGALTVKPTSALSGFTLSANSGGYSELVRRNVDGADQWSDGLRAYGASDWRIGANRIYHAGFKPTVADIGAAAASHTHTELGGSNYASGGSELPNYFGGGKLTYRMLGEGGTKGGIAGSAYSDAIWVSSYTGGDVKGSNVLLFSKGGAPRVGFRQQDYDATTWGTFNEIYHTGKKPTAGDVGALPLSGGTLTGILATNQRINQFKGYGNASTDLNTLLSAESGIWNYASNVNASGTPNIFPATNNANGVLTFNTHNGQYGRQIGFSSNGAMYTRHKDGTDWSTWRKMYDDANKPTAAEVGALPSGGTAVAATKLASIANTFTGVYPITVNANGVIYGHTSTQIDGSTGTISASRFKITANAGVFAGDSNYTTFTGSSFYIQSGAPITYIYSPTIYLGNTTGTTVYYRGNALTGNSWSMSTGGVLTTTNITTGDITSSSWLRTTGNGGLFCSTHGGGIHMTDATWLRIYNDKKFHISNVSVDALDLNGGIVARKTINSHGALGGSWGHTNTSAFTVTGSSSGSTYNMIGVEGGARIQCLGGTGGAVRVYPNGTNSGQYTNIDAAGLETTGTFKGNGSLLNNLRWANITDKPAAVSDWINLFNGGISGRTNRLPIPPQMLNHLKAGKVVELRIWVNRSGAIAGDRRCLQHFIDGTDGWVNYVNDKVGIDFTWYGASYVYVANASTGHGSNANCIYSQYQNITKIDMKLL